MPFRLADGRPYFEAVSLVPSADVELVENYLALCPTCAAKWRHAQETVDEDVAATAREPAGLEMKVRLAGADVAVRFVQVHMEDLRVALGAAGPPGA